MKEEQKIYIRGVYNRGKEVIKILEDYGASNPRGYIGDYDRALYFINHDNIIDCTRDHDAEFAKIVMDNYREIKLPEKWRNGDILIRKNGTYYRVFSDYDLSHITTFFAYNVSVSIKDEKITITSNEGCVWVCNREDYRLATPSEIKRFQELLHKHGKEWNSENKQLVDLKWKPSVGDKCWMITSNGKVNMFLWFNSETNMKLLDFGNCFRTKKEANIAVNRIKKSLKGEQ